GETGASQQVRGLALADDEEPEEEVIGVDAVEVRATRLLGGDLEGGRELGRVVADRVARRERDRRQDRLDLAPQLRPADAEGPEDPLDAAARLEDERVEEMKGLDPRVAPGLGALSGQ